MSKYDNSIPGKKWVFPKFIRKGDKIIYPKKAKCFAFLVDDTNPTK